MQIVACPSCTSADVEEDLDGVPGPGVATRCRSCDTRWRRMQTPICPRCGSLEVDQTGVDGQGYDDSRHVPMDPGGADPGHVERTVLSCRACRTSWTVAGESRPG